MQETYIVPPVSTKEACINRANELRSAKEVDDINHVNRRIAALDGGLGVIYVGGASKTEQKELFDRIEDSVLAVRAAKKEGIVPGSGIALMDSFLNIGREKVDTEEKKAAFMIMNSLSTAILDKILENARLDRDSKVLEGVTFGDGKGINLVTMEKGDLIEVGVIDTATAVTSSLTAAVSVASTLISTNSVIYKP